MVVSIHLLPIAAAVAFAWPERQMVKGESDEGGVLIAPALINLSLVQVFLLVTANGPV